MKRLTFAPSLPTVCLLITIAIVGCKSLTGTDDPEPLLSGTTNTGRKFDIFAHTLSNGNEAFKLKIDGEEAIVFAEIKPLWSGRLEPKIETVTVAEFAGTPALIQLTWESSDIEATASFIVRTWFHYLVVPRGNALTTLLQGKVAKSWSGHFAFTWGSGNASLEYDAPTLRLIQATIRGGDSGPICYGTEEELVWTYQVQPTEATLLTCESRTRSTEVNHGGGICVNLPALLTALAATPWTPSVCP